LPRARARPPTCELVFNDKLMKLNPNFKFTPFSAAVAKTCAWFEANYATARKGGH